MNGVKLEFAPRVQPRILPYKAQLAMALGASALVACVMLLSPEIAVVILVLVGGVALIASARAVYQRPELLILALLFVEVLPSITLLPIGEDQRPILRYPLYLLFALPLAPVIYRSHLLGRGGFRLYSIYFAWAALTATYSLAPAFSLGRAIAAISLFIAISAIASRATKPFDVERELRFFFIGCAILVVLLIATAIVPGLTEIAWDLDEELGGLRFSGYFDSPNQVGELAMVTIGVAIFCWPSWQANVMRIVSAAVIAISAALLLIADSRSAAAAMIVGVGAWVAWRYRRRGVLTLGLTLVALVVVASALGPQAMKYVNRHDVTSLTGRTEVWHFSMDRLAKSPLLGYGYSVEGAIFNNKYFPLWDDLWTQGPRIPIHNAYLSRAVGLGIPALLLWLFLFFRPFIFVFRTSEDPMNLKPLALLIVLPILILSMSETLGGDCRYPAGVIMTLVWALAEVQRLKNLDSTASAISEHAFEHAGAHS
jgi:O-antigen ligase